MGPTLVSQTNTVPTPSRRSVTNRIDSASVIQSTCDAMSRKWRQTRLGGASMSVWTRMRGMSRDAAR